MFFDVLPCLGSLDSNPPKIQVWRRQCVWEELCIWSRRYIWWESCDVNHLLLFLKFLSGDKNVFGKGSIFGAGSKFGDKKYVEYPFP